MTETVGLQVELRNPADQQLSTRRYVSVQAGGTDTWETRIIDGGAVTFSKIVFDGRQLLNAVRPQLSIITLDNADGALDTILGYEWKCRPAIVSYFRDIGGSTTIFTGKTLEIEYDLKLVRVAVSDCRQLLDSSVQLNAYAGTGAAEGAAGLKDKFKPRIFGLTRQLEPVPIDLTALTYQVHDGDLTGSDAGINAVRDGGLDLTLDTSKGVSGDLSSYADLASGPNTPGAGQYTTWLAGGMFRIGSAPAFTVTAEAFRQQTGEVATSTDIIKEILTERGQTIFVESFNTANTKAGNAAAGYFVGTESVTTETAITELIKGVFGYWYTTATGDWGVWLLDVISGSIAEDLTDKFALPTLISRAAKVTPPANVIMTYRKNWLALPPSQIAAGVSAALQVEYQQEARTLTKQPPDAEASGDFEFHSFIYDDTEANNLGNRIIAFYNGVKRIIQIEVARETPLSSDLGQIVRLSIGIEGQGRLGLLNKNFEVFGVEELLGQGRARLTIGGPA